MSSASVAAGELEWESSRGCGWADGPLLGRDLGWLVGVPCVRMQTALQALSSLLCRDEVVWVFQVSKSQEARLFGWFLCII